jgi:DNA end-binding protein Ku
MAESLIENLTSSFDPTEYKDNYREALLQVVEKKIAGEEIEVIPEAEAPKVVDLMEALKASVAATKTKKPAAPKRASAASSTRRKKAAAS